VGLTAFVAAAPALADDTVKDSTSASTQQQQQQQQQQQPQGTASQASQASTTTLSAASTDPALAPTVQTTPRERDTVTLYQQHRPNKAYLYTGGALFLGSYVTTAVVNATSDIDRTLYIPVVGPWLHIADRGDNADTFGTVMIVGSGIVQGAGVLLSAASLFIPEKVPAATIQAGDVRLNVSPTAFGRGSAGVGAVGTF
jgi:hypothetical protein